MTDTDLDRSYTALCEAMAELGPARTELFLSMTCLALMARYERAAGAGRARSAGADDVISLIGNVRAQCHAEARNSDFQSP